MKTKTKKKPIQKGDIVFFTTAGVNHASYVQHGTGIFRRLMHHMTGKTMLKVTKVPMLVLDFIYDFDVVLSNPELDRSPGSVVSSLEDISREIKFGETKSWTDTRSVNQGDDLDIRTYPFVVLVGDHVERYVMSVPKAFTLEDMFVIQKPGAPVNVLVPSQENA
jgi:hypothetical protein